MFLQPDVTTKVTGSWASGDSFLAVDHLTGEHMLV